MDFLTIWSLLGFLFAVYAVTANDSIQTLGTYISSNRDIKWYWMFGYMGSIFVFTMIQGFSINDPAFGRLDKFEPITIQWYHALAPLVLVALTRLKIPVSTTFLVLSVFATSIVMEQMLIKSFVGYAVSFVFACGSWYLISKYFLYEGEKGNNKYNNYWRVAQWLTTGWLWSTWLKHDLANIMIFLPRYSTVQSFQFQLFVVLIMLFGLAFGYKIGLATVSLYLLEGIAGLPVFSNSPEKGVGLVYFTGPTMGYLIGFLSATLIAGTTSSNDNLLKIISKLLLSVSTIYILGVLWLGTLIGWDKPILEFGVYPFLLAEIFKLALLVIISKKIINLRKFI